MVTIECHRCGNKQTRGTVSQLVSFSDEELDLPEGWFEHDGQIYCGKHLLRPVPLTHEVVDL